MPGLFAELKRRRVVRALVVYLIVAWGTVEVADVVVPNVGLPQWTVTLVILLAALGAPIALVLAWLYDVTPSGIERAPASVLSASRGLTLILVGMVLGLVAFGAYWRIQPRSGDHVEANSIVVLPFVDMSATQDQEYLGDGITEEILNALAQVKGLRVPARTTSFAFKGKDIPVATIAQQLGVGHVLEGSVRKQGDMVRITAQLIDASSDKHLWSETFDRKLDDVFAVQEQISKAIVDLLRLELGEARLVDRETASGQAHEHYLKGLYHWNRRHTAQLALDEFEAATKLDPNYARAWAGLALTYAVLPQYSEFDPTEASRKGKEAAARALQLDPKAADAHAALSQIAQELDWEWQASLEHADEALRLDPSYATAHQWRAEILLILRRCGDALAGADRSLEIDPLSTVMHNVRALILMECDQLPAAYEAFKRIVKRDPDFRPGAWNAYDAALRLGLYDEAVQFVRDPALEDLALAMKDPSRRPGVLQDLGSAPDRLQNPVRFAYAYARLGEADSALVMLLRATDKHPPHAAFLFGWVHRFEDNPRYVELLRRLKFGN